MTDRDTATTAPCDTERPRWSQIATDIAVAIERGTYADGALLPSATAIAAEYGVHRHTARQALHYLQDLGLVSIGRGRGTIVTGRRFPYRIGRRVSFRANFGAAGVQVTGEVLEASVEEPSRQIAGLLGLATDAPIWEIRTSSSAAGMPVSTSLHRLSVERFPGFDRRLADAGASITAAFASYGIADYVRLSTRLTARRAYDREAAILGLAPGSPVMQSFALDGLVDGTPLQVVVGVFAGDRVEMVLELEQAP